MVTFPLRWLTHGLLVVTSLLLGLFFWNVLSNPSTQGYPFATAQAQWISGQSSANQGYFCKEFYLDSRPVAAWAKIAATDSITIYLNGHRLDNKGPAPNHVSGLYDITPLLASGKNLFALEVRRVAFPGDVKVALEAEITDSGGERRSLFTDATWRVAHHPQYQGERRIPWQQLDFEHDKWGVARVVAAPAAEEVLPFTVPPGLFLQEVSGLWIGSPAPRARSVVFSHDLLPPQEMRETWISLSASGPYVLSINGDYVTENRDPGSLDQINITSFLKPGPNQLDVAVTVLTSSAPQLFMNGFAVIDDTGNCLRILQSDSSWHTYSASESSPAAPATILRPFSLFSVTTPLPKRIINVTPPFTFTLQSQIQLGLCLAIATTLIYGGALATRRLSAPILDPDAASNPLRWGTLAQLPTLTLLLFITLLQFDSRIDTHRLFGPWMLMGILLIWLGGFFGGLRSYQQRQGTVEMTCTPIISPLGLRRITGLVLVLLLATGFYLRYETMTLSSLSHDEIGISELAATTLERGYPIMQIGPIEKPLTTYEVLPYPIALSLFIFGSSDFATRLPAVLLSCATLFLIYVVGRRLWNPLAGLLAAAIYTFSSFSLLWGTNAFHPQQTQFLTLLTTYCFYRALEKKELQVGWHYAACASFCLTYLSWEGSGILLLGLFLYLLAVRGHDFSWARSFPLWLGVGSVLLLVVVQMSFRTLTRFPYMVVGKGLSGKTIGLNFLSPDFDGFFYFNNYLFQNDHMVMSLLLAGALPFLFRDRGIRFCLVYLGTLIALLTFIVPNISSRYAYFTLPFLILGAAAVVCKLLSRVLSSLTLLRESRFLRSCTLLFAVALPLLLLAASSNQLLNRYRLGNFNSWVASPVPPTTNYRSTDNYIASHWQPGDILIGLMPHTIQHYTGLSCDYFIQEYTQQQILLDPRPDAVGYMDKFSGTQVIRNYTELRQILDRASRVWFKATPMGVFQSVNSSQTLRFISNNATPVYEDYQTLVYLWER
ncbi:MAG: hypothetical protein C0621_02300 [Desulfuromonas sp.]|nr:MAG: hypothetical protein C0621_02300 [Desulfuromonas sp.]